MIILIPVIIIVLIIIIIIIIIIILILIPILIPIIIIIIIIIISTRSPCKAASWLRLLSPWLRPSRCKGLKGVWRWKLQHEGMNLGKL